MKLKRRAFLGIEQLEDRWVPATVKFVSGTLFISPSAGEAALNLSVQQSATIQNTFTVKDGTSSNGTYGPVSNINITGGNGADTITVDVNANNYTGSIFVSSSNGADTVVVTNGTGTGSIGGNINIVAGYGPDSVSISPGQKLTIGGSVQVTSPTGNASVTLGNGNGGAGATIFGGSVTLTNISGVNLGVAGNGNIVGNSVTVQDAALNTPVSVTVADSFNVNKNLTITAGSGADTVTFNGTTVGGATQVTLGSGNDAVTVTSGKAPSFEGDLNITLGSGTDTVALTNGTTVSGNFRLTLGDGNDDLTGLARTFSVAGSAYITLGGGSDTVTMDGLVGGSLTFRLGNDSDTVTIGNAPGGTLFWTSGNGADSVTFGDANSVAGEVWNVNMKFGTGSDTLTLDDSTGNAPSITPATPDFLTGFIDMGGPPAGNSFDSTGSLATGSWIILQPFTLQNV